MGRILFSVIVLLCSSGLGYSQKVGPIIDFLDSPQSLNTEAGDSPYIAFNGVHGDGAQFARLFSFNTTGVAANAVIHVQEFDAHLKLKYSKPAPNLDTVLVGNARPTRIFYLGGVLHFCYYRLDGPDQFFYIFKSAFDHDSLALHLVHVEQVQGSLFDSEQFFNKTMMGYDYSYDMVSSPSGELALLTLIGSRRTGEKNTLLVRTFRSNFELVWQKQVELPASPNVFMLKNAGQQTLESLKQDYSFRPYAVNRVMNGLPQLTGAVLDDASNAFVRIDETTEEKKVFGIRYRVPQRRRDWFSFYEVGTRVVTQYDAGDRISLDATISRDSLTVYSCVPRQEYARIPGFRVPVRSLLPPSKASDEFIVNAISRDSLREVYLAVSNRRDKDQRGDGFQLLRLSKDGSLRNQQFVAAKNFNEVLSASIEGGKFTVLYSTMPKTQVVTGFNAMLKEFSASIWMTTMDTQGKVTTTEIRKMAAEGPNVIYRSSSMLFMAWYSHDDKKLLFYSLLKMAGMQ